MVVEIVDVVDLLEVLIVVVVLIQGMSVINDIVYGKNLIGC